MLRKYGYIGILLILLVEVNYLVQLQLILLYSIPIFWFGYILFVDSIVYKIKKRSFISSHFKEFIFSIILSVPFWLLFEVYNIFTQSWFYINYTWMIHLLFFATIMPSVLITFSLLNVLNVGHSFDSTKKYGTRSNTKGLTLVKLLIPFGAIVTLIPVINPIGFPLMCVGFYLMIDPFNYLTGRTSIIHMIIVGKRSTPLNIFLAGLIVGFFWELTNYQAYTKWIYEFPIAFANVKIFYMPILGYIGYLPFTIELFVFYVLFHSFIFKEGNELLHISKN